MIRAAVEYCSTVYHSLIPKYMSDKLERVQRQAMKIIFGHHCSYSALIDDGVVQILESRRIKNCLSFAIKAAASDRFGKKWFPVNGNGREVRTSTRRKYIERQHRTERSRNNPIQSMIRQLNEQESS